MCSALTRVQPRVVSYEEQVTGIREQLAELLEEEEDWAGAAKILAGIDLDSGACACLSTDIPPLRQSACPARHDGIVHVLAILSLLSRAYVKTSLCTIACTSAAGWVERLWT